MAETGHKETFTNAMAEASLNYVKDLVQKNFYQTIF